MNAAESYVPLIVIGIIVLIVFLAGRPRTESPPTDEPPSGAELIERLQQTLGIAIVVESVEAVQSTDRPEIADTVRIRATLLSGTHTAPVVAVGPTESDAWAELAKAAIAWRNADFQHIPMWWGAG